MIHIPATYATPHSPIHERDVVSCLLNYPTTFDDYPHLTEDHFHLPDTKIVFRFALAQRERGHESTDLSSMLEEMSQKGQLDRIGGASGFSDFLTRPSFPQHLPQHVEKLNAYLARRIAIESGLGLVRSAFEDEDAQELLEAAGGPITAIHDAMAALRPQLTMKRIIGESFYGYKERLEGKSTPMGIPTLPEIDHLIRGMHGGRVYIIGAYSGGGKSVLSSQIITLCALAGFPCLEINYEMTEKDSMDRKLIQMSRVPSQAFMDPLQYARDNDCAPINVEFMRNLTTVKDALLKAPLYIRKPQNCQLRTLLSMIRKHVREFGIKVVAIDYLQRVRQKSHSPEGEITEISHALQEISGELGISILLLSQLNERGDTKHGIVAVEDCDAYLIIEQERNKDLETFGQHFDILIAKDRHCGNTGKTIPLIFDPRTVRFIHGFVPKKQKNDTPQKKQR
jgi:replicative DNA helicase